jgi:hypothetical protein
MNFIENIKLSLNKIMIYIIIFLLILSMTVPTALVLWGVYEFVVWVTNNIK